MMDSKTAALLYDAIKYTLNRMQMEPEFRWHMLDTETFARLTTAEAAYLGRDVDEVRALRERDLQPEYRVREPECVVNRDRVRDLEGLLEAHGIEYPPRQ